MMKPTTTSILKNYLMTGFVILAVGLGIAAIVLTVAEFSRFYQANERHNQLATLGRALQQYREEKGRFPVIPRNGTSDDSLGTWRVQILPYLLRDVQSVDDIGEVTHAIEQTPFVAVLNIHGCVWDEDVTGTFRDLHQCFGNPIIAVYAPNLIIDWEQSNELIIEESKVSFQQTGSNITIHDLEHGLALRLDGTIEMIPSFSEESQLYEYLGSRESF